MERERSSFPPRQNGHKEYRALPSFSSPPSDMPQLRHRKSTLTLFVDYRLRSQKVVARSPTSEVREIFEKDQIGTCGDHHGDFVMSHSFVKCDSFTRRNKWNLQRLEFPRALFQMFPSRTINRSSLNFYETPRTCFIGQIISDLILSFSRIVTFKLTFRAVARMLALLFLSTCNI